MKGLKKYEVYDKTANAELNEKEQEEKNTCTFSGPAWYENYNQEGRFAFRNFLRGGLPYISTFLMVTILVFALCAIVLGNGAYVYSEETYQHIENSINEFLQGEGTSKDLVALQEQVDSVSYSTTGGTKLICNIRQGFFNAKVTVDLSKGFESAKMIRNFKSRNQFMILFWSIFGVCVFVGGTALWIAIQGISHLLSFIRAKLYEMFESMKVRRSERKSAKY